MQGMSGLAIPTKQADVECPIHHIRMRYVPNGKFTEPFCMKCVAEKTEVQKQEHDKSIISDSSRRYFKGYSLLDNSEQYNHTFSNFKVSKGSREAKIGNVVFKIASEYVQNPTKAMNTILLGNPGEGKSHLAMAMINKIVAETNQRCVYVDVSELFRHWLSSFKDNDTKWSGVRINQILGAKKHNYSILGADVIVLDDLGSESSMKSEATEATNAKQDILKGILDRQKRVIITTNLTVEQIKRVYNPKIVSRLLAHSQGRLIDFSGIADKRIAG